MTLTILLSARHVHEIGILALQVDESIVMKLMMSSSKRNARLYRERIGVAAPHYRFSTTSLWYSNGSGKASTWMIPRAIRISGI
jgi:hypothetical protein